MELGKTVKACKMLCNLDSKLFFPKTDFLQNILLPLGCLEVTSGRFYPLMHVDLHAAVPMWTLFLITEEARAREGTFWAQAISDLIGDCLFCELILRSLDHHRTIDDSFERAPQLPWGAVVAAHSR